MCAPQAPEGERRSKKATARWYEDQRRSREDGGEEDGPWRGPSGWQGPSGWHPRFGSAGLRLLLAGRPLAWARWVLVDLDRHKPSCRWRRLARAGRGGRVRPGPARS